MSYENWHKLCNDPSWIRKSFSIQVWKFSGLNIISFYYSDSAQTLSSFFAMESFNNWQSVVVIHTFANAWIVQNAKTFFGLNIWSLLLAPFIIPEVPIDLESAFDWRKFGRRKLLRVNCVLNLANVDPFPIWMWTEFGTGTKNQTLYHITGFMEEKWNSLNSFSFRRKRSNSPYFIKLVSVFCFYTEFLKWVLHKIINLCMQCMRKGKVYF